MATGFVGIGIMGEGMAARLLSQGVAGTSDKNPLVIWNRTKSKCTALQEQFSDKKIIIKDTAKEVVEACAITYSMLSTPEVAKLVFEAEDGVLAGVGEGKSIVDCATLAEEDMKRMNDAVVKKGGYVLLRITGKWRESGGLYNFCCFVNLCLISILFHLLSIFAVVSWKPPSRVPKYQQL